MTPEPAWDQGGGNNPPSVSELDERLYRRGVGYRGRLGGKSAWQSEGERSDSEANRAEDAQGGAALDSDGLERTIEDASKVTDVDHLQDVGRLARERDPQKYPYTHLTSLTTSNYVAGNPLYDILHDGRTAFDGPPLLSLKSLGGVKPVDGTAVTEWKVDMPALTITAGGYSGLFIPLKRFTGALPNLQEGRMMFYRSGLTSWDVELPSLTSATWMFRNTKLTEWHIDLPNLVNGDAAYHNVTTMRSYSGNLSRLTNGSQMLQNSPLESFSSPLPSLTNGYAMFSSSKLGLSSVQTIAGTIKDNTSMTTPPTLTLGVARSLQGQVDAELDLIRAKGWVVNASYR